MCYLDEDKYVSFKEYKNYCESNNIEFDENSFK